MMRTTLLLAVGLLSSACVINGDRWPRPSELSPSWLVDRTRILGIRAIPAEIAPGQRAEFEALIGQPPDAEEGLVRLWLACPDGDNGCATTELGSVDLENPDPEQLAKLGFIGVEVGLPGEPKPAYTAPPDLLDELPDEARLEGLSVTAQLTAFPAEQLEAKEAPDEIDFNEVESGFKRLVVSEARTPNDNPVLVGILQEGIEDAPTAEVAEVRAGATIELTLAIEEAATIVTYEFVNSSGEVEERVEEPFVTWFATEGEVLEPFNLWPFFSSEWSAPAEVGVEGIWYAVVRDRRGGMSWETRRWVTVDP